MNLFTEKVFQSMGMTLRGSSASRRPTEATLFVSKSTCNSNMRTIADTTMLWNKDTKDSNVSS